MLDSGVASVRPAAKNTKSSIPSPPPTRSALPRRPSLAAANIHVDHGGLAASLGGTSSGGGRVDNNGRRRVMRSVLTMLLLV
ncbi:hypothetical protein KC349_g1 [Hortaea werneckii]|nr:hypothetical protein KC349_g1 [Hortaea werneckii]